MDLKLIRQYKRATYTIGKLYIDGKYFCDTLEDTDRSLKSNMSLKTIENIKKPSITAIPTGIYEISLNIVSPKFSNYTKYKWAKDINGKVPRLINVPGFSGVLIHPSGNKAEDTDGCILVGMNKVVGQVINSQATFRELYKILSNSKDKVTIKII